MIGMTSLLLDTPLAQNNAKGQSSVKRSGDILLTIVNDILDFSKIEAGKLALESIDFELNAALSKMYSSWLRVKHSQKIWNWQV